MGISRDTHYEWLRTDPAYAEEYAAAREEANEELEAEAWRRARWGTARPVYQMGMLVGYTQEYSDPLLIQLLKAHLPEKYRERVEQSGTVRHESDRDLTKLTDEELAQTQKHSPGYWRAIGDTLAQRPPLAPSSCSGTPASEEPHR